MESVITTVIGLAVGIMTGYYFEWRSSKATRQHNAELEQQLRVLREGLYSVGAAESPDRNGNRQTPVDLENALLHWVREHQGPDGTVERRRVVQRFLSRGHELGRIHDYLATLDERGLIKLGDVIEVL